MRTQDFGTAKAASSVLAMATALLSPTVYSIPGSMQQVPQYHFQKTSSEQPPLTDLRPTTTQEKIIGEIRSWSLFAENWDSEGSMSPKAQSIKEAVSFIRLLDDNISPPEPMLLSSGNISLFWDESDLYADIEFLGDHRIAYFIKKNGDKHKGVLKFDSQQMPTVFSALLKS